MAGQLRSKKGSHSHQRVQHSGEEGGAVRLGTISGRAVKVSCTIFALLIWSTVGSTQGQVEKSLFISGVVQTEDGTRLAGVSVRVTHVAGRPTSDVGEFKIPLTSQYQPGSEVLFDVPGWIIKNPIQGREFVPLSPTACVIIVVIPKPNHAREQHAKPKTDPITGRPKH